MVALDVELGVGVEHEVEMAGLDDAADEGAEVELGALVILASLGPALDDEAGLVLWGLRAGDARLDSGEGRKGGRVSASATVEGIRQGRSAALRRCAEGSRGDGEAAGSARTWVM